MDLDINSILKIFIDNYTEILQILGENNISMAQFIGLAIGFYELFKKTDHKPDPKSDTESENGGGSLEGKE